MKPLSEQLKDLSDRAKKAEDDAAAARTEARSKVQARTDQLQADAAERKSKARCEPWHQRRMRLPSAGRICRRK